MTRMTIVVPQKRTIAETFLLPNLRYPSKFKPEEGYHQGIKIQSKMS